MAIRFTGAPQTFSGDILTNSSLREMDLGAKIIGNDGSEYRYCKVGATALVPGKLYDGPAVVPNHANCSVAVAAAIGATSVTITLGNTAATANQYEGGKMIVNDVTGEGYTYYIKSNPAANASASLVVTLDPATPIAVALDTSSQVTLIPNQYNGVIIHAATETGTPVGAAFTAVTANYYGFLQTRGAIALLQDSSAGALGQSVAASTTTDGAGTVGTGALVPIGTYISTGVSTEYNAVFLAIA